MAGLLLPGAGWGQMPPDSSPGDRAITGTGMASVKRQPTILRMHLVLTAKGKTAEEAVAVLKARRQTAIAELVKLGADKKSIQPGSLSVSATENRRRQQLQAMIRQRMRQGGAAGKTPKIPESVNVAATLTADWPITVKDPEELFLTVQDLQRKVKTAKLGTGKEAEKLSPEEEELAEEMRADTSYSPYGEDESEPNTPMFFYVAKITEEDRSKATAEAVAKAKADAQRLAQAAGAQLGPMTGLSATAIMRSFDPDSFPGQASPRYYRQMMNAYGMAGQQSGDENEAIAPDPSQITLTVQAMANFKFGTPSGAK
jgi:uncharacterized protein YggE